MLLPVGLLLYDMNDRAAAWPFAGLLASLGSWQGSSSATSLLINLWRGCCRITPAAAGLLWVMLHS